MNSTSLKPSFNKLILGMVSVFVFAVLLGEAYAWFERRIPGESAPWLGAFLVNAALALLVVLIWWRRGDWGLIPEAKWPRLGGITKSQVLGSGAGLGSMMLYAPSLIVLSGAIFLGLASPLFGEPERASSFSTSQWLFVFIVPVVEEWTFRVGAGSYFRKICGPFWGAYLAAMLFSLVHSLPTWSRILELKFGLLPGPLLLGIICEILLIGSGRILPAIAFHMACNATVIVFTVTDGRWLRWLDFLYVGR